METRGPNRVRLSDVSAEVTRTPDNRDSIASTAGISPLRFLWSAVDFRKTGYLGSELPVFERDSLGERHECRQSKTSNGNDMRRIARDPRDRCAVHKCKSGAISIQPSGSFARVYFSPAVYDHRRWTDVAI